MPNNPLISIVIPTYNRKKSAERLIKSILRSSYKKFEIIVIDDASRDETSDYLKAKFKNNKKVNIFRNKINLFAAGSKNEGQKRAKGKYIAFIDDDNVVDSKMLLELVNVLEEKIDVGEVAPINYNFNNKNKILLTRSTRNMWTTKTLHLRTLKPFNGKKTWGADDAPNAFMVRGDVLRQNKISFNQDYGIMYEESDYAYKIKKSGYKVNMVRNAKIYHDIEDSITNKKSKDYLYHFMDDPRRAFTFARNRIIFHNLYSTRIQQLGIYLFWIWFFSIYYIYKFLFYNGYGNFDLKRRIYVAKNYLKGNIKGLSSVLRSVI
jgi:GT2 family glycosyltransferase